MKRYSHSHFLIVFNLILVFSLVTSTCLTLTQKPQPVSAAPLIEPVISDILSSDTPNPVSVNIPGSQQSEIGCPGDWDPACTNTFLTFDATDAVWQGTFTVPTGSYEYKAALNGGWDENYGQNSQRDGPNIPLNLSSDLSVKFYYDHETHWITSNANTTIATAPGSYQDAIGCPGDWQPDCLRSWLQDPDGNGVFEFSTEAIPPGNYEVKVTHNESWDENYGAGGAQNGPNIPFSVFTAGSIVKFSYDLSSHILTITVKAPGHNPDNNVEYYGLGHNSHDLLYRVPFGAITPGTKIILRFRTYHNDVTSVKARIWDGVANQQSFLKLTPAAIDVSCYDDNQPSETCDFWQAEITPNQPTTLYYRFIVQDGTATAYYDDDYQQDGGWGEAASQLQDDSYVIQVYDPSFTPIPWMQNAVFYQIFPDRFRDGNRFNNPKSSEPRYGFPDNVLDQILNMGWTILPEGYCRHYQNPAEPCVESPRGRDYYGGDLKGIQSRLPYLKDLGITTIYLNPIFEAASNHAYDTQDYYKIDKSFGSNKEFDKLVRAAKGMGIKIVIDGVFNHVSSDSPYFDRYHHFTSVGACESIDSPYRSWFYFQDMEGGPCVGPNGPNTMTYSGWFGFDSLPVLDKSNPQIQALFYGNSGSVGQYWLLKGAAGWRLDVMGDSSFPSDFWPEFRSAMKHTNPNSIVIGELWKKHEVLPKARGDQADTTMNYRFRNAILGFLGQIDYKGFPDDGQSDQPPSLFASKMISVREDYPDAVYYTQLNLMDSHDTQRILWALTPGESNREQREFNQANVSLGKERLKLAVVVQMTTPGAPTIFYGDEVGLTGDDDPDDRRTFPWAGNHWRKINGDLGLFDHYKKLISLRKSNDVFSNGVLSFLLTDDSDRTLAYMMRTSNQAAIVAINRDELNTRTFTLDVGGKLPSSVKLKDTYGSLGNVNALNGLLTFNLPPLSAAIFLPVKGQDLTSPVATRLSLVNEGNGQVDLAWTSIPDATTYNVYRSPVTGGGYLLAGQNSGNSFSDSGLLNGMQYFYVVKGVDAAGNEGAPSNEVVGLPHYQIGWANLQWPPSMSHTISVINHTDTAYGQVWIDGVTSQPGATPTLWAQLGFGPDGTNPAGNPTWNWVDASFNVDTGNNDEFKASMLPEMSGVFDYVFRYSTTGGRDWLYADLNGPVSAASLPANPGNLTVNTSGDLDSPVAPSNLQVVSASPNSINLDWDDVSGDPSLYGYEVLRGDGQGGPYTMIARVIGSDYTDTGVEQDATYFYVVQAVDLSFNRSGNSNEVQVTASPRTVSITLSVTIPAGTPAGSTVYIAGSLDRLDGGLPQWDPGGLKLTMVDATHWTITLTGKEATEIEYKYTLGTWDLVEKGATCEEIANRKVILSYGTNGTQTIEDTVFNWRNVTPCGP